MLDFTVSAAEDQDRPEGGHAVLVIEGVPELSEPVRFQLTPTDPDEATPAYDVWHKPLVERATDESLVLVVGPDLTESPLFVTGREYELSIDQVEGRGRFIWPIISPLIQTKRRTLLTRATSRDDVTEPKSATPVGMSSSSTTTATSLSTTPDTSVAARAPSVKPAVSDDNFGTARHMAVAQIGVAPEHLRPNDEDTRDRATDDASLRNVSRLAQNPFVVAAVSAALVLGAQQLFASEKPPAIANDTTAVATQSALRQIPPNAIYELLAVGATSPRGQDARDVSAQRALDRANQALQGSAAKDVGEATFWLKHAALTAQGQDRAARALTQLGTLHTETGPGLSADYAKARALWEIAAAMGDAGANFFLGQIHEFGLGVPKDIGAARAWYLKAQARGAFPGVDEALARVKPTNG